LSQIRADCRPTFGSNLLPRRQAAAMCQAWSLLKWDQTGEIGCACGKERISVRQRCMSYSMYRVLFVVALWR